MVPSPHRPQTGLDQKRVELMTPMHEKILSEHPEGEQCYGEMLFFRPTEHALVVTEEGTGGDDDIARG